MNIISAINPIYSKSDNSTIDVQATFSNGRVFSYTATPFDNTDYGIQLWQDLQNGVHGTIAPYKPIE